MPSDQSNFSHEMRAKLGMFWNKSLQLGTAGAGYAADELGNLVRGALAENPDAARELLAIEDAFIQEMQGNEHLASIIVEEHGGVPHPIRDIALPSHRVSIVKGVFESELQGLWDPITPVTLPWLDQLRELAERIVRITSGSRTVGTGTIIRGGQLYEPWGNQAVVLTANHVAGTGCSSAIAPEKAGVTIDAIGARRRGAGALFESAIEDLDVTILSLDVSIDTTGNLRIAAPPPVDSFANVIGYSGGGDLKFSIRGDNRIAAVCERYVHYTTATTGGASGAPVTDNDHDLVAQHTRFDSAMVMNRGTRIDAILKAIREKYKQ